MKEDEKGTTKDLKTKSLQFRSTNYIDKKFIYQSDFDNNGICHFFGTNFSTEPWQNPVDRGLIKIEVYPKYWTSFGRVYGKDSDVLSRKTVNCWVHGKENNWFCIIFPDNIKITPNKYSLKHSSGGYNQVLRNWNIWGSNNGFSWHGLKCHKNDQSFITHEYNAGASHTFPIDNCKIGYSRFRIKQTGTNGDWINGSLLLSMGGFEIYGHLVGDV